MNDLLRVATYNIHACVGRDGVFDPNRIVQVLSELNADVIALQEVEHHLVGSHDLLDFIADSSGFRAVAGPTFLRSERHYGNALLTRRPLSSVDLLDLTTPRCEPRGAIEAVLDWNGQAVQIMATHLGLRPWERRRQLRRLLDRCAASTLPYSILLGDLNEWLLWGRPLRWLRQQFADVPHVRTYPARFPLFALDRIWVHPRVALQDIRAHRSPLARVASDHLPLTCTLARVARR